MRPIRLTVAVLSLLAFGVPTPGQLSFPPVRTFGDVAFSDRWYGTTDLLRERNITVGCQGSPVAIYCPDFQPDRAMVSILVIRSIYSGLYGDPEAFGTPPGQYFTDVPPSHWAFRYIQQMKYLGITTGCAENVYCPEAPTANFMLAIFTVRARWVRDNYGAIVPANWTPPHGTSPQRFNDIPYGHVWFPWVQRAYELVGPEIYVPAYGGSFYPDSPTTRGQASFYLIYGILGSQGLPPNYQPGAVAFWIPSVVNGPDCGLNAGPYYTNEVYQVTADSYYSYSGTVIDPRDVTLWVSGLRTSLNRSGTTVFDSNEVQGQNSATYRYPASGSATLVAGNYLQTSYHRAASGACNTVIPSAAIQTTYWPANGQPTYLPVLYYLATAVSPTGGGTISPPSGWYNSGQVVTVTATPNTGYQFAGFTGALRGTTNPQNLTMNGTKSVTATFTPALTITTAAPLPGGTAEMSYSQTLAATGGTPPYNWSVASGLLPSGLSLSSAGVLSGTPATASSYTFTVQVTDNSSQTASKPLSVTITGPSIYPTQVEINLSAFPIDKYLDLNTTGSGGALIGGCSPSMTVRQCVQHLFYNPAQPCATADPSVTPNPNNWRSQGVTGVRFFFTLAGGWYSTPYDSNGNVQLAWSNNLGQFFQDLRCYGITRVTPTPVFDPWSWTAPMVARSVNSCGQIKTLNFVPWLPFGLDPADNNFPDRSCANSNTSYFEAAQTPGDIFWGWTRFFNVIDTVLAKAAATTPTRLGVDAFDYYQESNLDFTVQARMIYDSYRGVNVLQELRNRMSAHGYDPLRIAPSANQSVPDVGTFDCGSFFGDSAMLMPLSQLTAALAGPYAKFGEPPFLRDHNRNHMLMCLDTDASDPYDDVLNPMIQLPLSYSQPTFIDIHSSKVYPSLSDTAARAKNFYSGIWGFMVYRNRTENYVAFGESNPVENPACGTFTPEQAKAMLFGNLGQDGYKNSTLYLNRPANVVMRPWHRTEGVFSGCTSSPNVVNVPYNPNP